MAEAEERTFLSVRTIYELARAYRQTFTLRHAPFLFIYTLFCATTVIPLDADTFGSHASVISFFCDCLEELETTRPDGLKKPIIIIRNRFERAGINLDALRAIKPMPEIYYRREVGHLFFNKLRLQRVNLGGIEALTKTLSSKTISI